MPLPSDHRLTDPSAAAVRAAVNRARAAANGRRKTGTVNLSDGAAALLGKQVAGRPEGYAGYSGDRLDAGSARVAVAWWTAPGGRKLVRVRGWRNPLGVFDRKAELDRRPAVWHLDPERVTRAEADGSAGWVAVCGCGAAGSAEALAWAGGTCGPCRDRADEHGPAAVAHEPGLLTDPGFVPSGVGFSPSGEHLVAVGSPGWRVWDPRTGQLLQAGGRIWHNTRAATPAVGPDGRSVFSYGAADLLVCYGPPSWANPGCVVPLGESGHSVHWTGRPGELLVQRGYYGNRGVRLVTVPAGRAGRSVPPPRPGAELVAVRPDPVAPRAVFCDYGHAVVARVGRKGELHPEHEFRLGAGAHDRTGFWTATPGLVRFTADGERLLFVAHRAPAQWAHELAAGEYLELWNPARPKALLQVTFPARVCDAHFSPDGEHLFVLGGDGSVFVCHPGLVTHVRARLVWHLGPARGLAVSPDGRVLATAGDEGVKLWPVARLLEVP